MEQIAGGIGATVLLILIILLLVWFIILLMIPIFIIQIRNRLDKIIKLLSEQNANLPSRRKVG